MYSRLYDAVRRGKLSPEDSGIGDGRTGRSERRLDRAAVATIAGSNCIATLNHSIPTRISPGAWG